MLIQVYIPIRVANRIGGTIQLLIEALKTQSEWILISKNNLIKSNNFKTSINLAI